MKIIFNYLACMT